MADDTVVGWVQEAWRNLTLIEILVVAVIAGLILAIAFAADSREDADALCLDAGYTEAKVVSGTVYCIRQRNGTDEVIRLDKRTP